MKNMTNRNHHLWNNHGTWFVCYTVYPTPLTKERRRESLRTKSLAEARRRRSELFARLRDDRPAVSDDSDGHDGPDAELGFPRPGFVFNATGDEGGPAGLVARADAAAGVGVEIFVE
jgi:hypothetical protein